MSNMIFGGLALEVETEASISRSLFAIGFRDGQAISTQGTVATIARSNVLLFKLADNIENIVAALVEVTERMAQTRLSWNFLGL